MTMTKTGKISAIFIAVCFVVLYVHRKSGWEGAAAITLGLSAAYLANVALYVANAVKRRISWWIAIFWIYSISLFYTAAFFFKVGPDSLDRIFNILAVIIMVIVAALIWFWTRKKSDKTKYAHLFWDFVPIWIGVQWLGLIL